MFLRLVDERGFLFVGGDAGDVKNSARVKNFHKIKLAHAREFFKRTSEFFDGVTHDAIFRVSDFGRARRYRHEEFFVFKRGARRAVSPAVFHDFINVKLEQTGHAEPVCIGY